MAIYERKQYSQKLLCVTGDYLDQMKILIVKTEIIFIMLEDLIYTGLELEFFGHF